ncbi:MAG TPA: tetratricopeptide repeat protein [Acidobacteriota bacterium]|nr:tetratricopeptide repeat protein [Acidobacteriota bacterium]
MRTLVSGLGRRVAVAGIILVLMPGLVVAEVSDEAKRQFNNGVEYEKADKPDSAIAAYTAALAEAPDYLDAHINVGALYYQKGDLTNAAQHLEHAVRLDSTQASAYKNLGLVRQQAEEYPAAVAAFTRYLSYQPDDGGAWASLAQVYKESGEKAKAVDAYNKALAADPEDYRSAYNLGNILQEQKKFEAAKAAYLKAIGAKSNYVEAYYNLAICSHQIDFESCVPDYEAFIAKAGTSKKWTKQVTQARDIIKQINDYLDVKTD